MFGVGLCGLLREGVSEELDESRYLQELRRLKVDHPVRVQKEERHVLLRGVILRVEPAYRVRRLPGEATEEEAVVERRAENLRRLAPHAIQLVEPAGGQEGVGRRRLVGAGGRGDKCLPADREDVGQSRERIDQRVTREQRGVAQLREDRLGPPADDEVPVLVGVAAALAAHVEVEHRAGLA